MTKAPFAARSKARLMKRRSMQRGNDAESYRKTRITSI